MFPIPTQACFDAGCKSLMWGVSRWNFGGKTFYQKLGAINTTDREQREFMSLNHTNLTKLVQEYKPPVAGGVVIHIEDDTERR